MIVAPRPADRRGSRPLRGRTFADSSGMRESCVLLRVKLSIPARMNRCYQRCTVTLLVRA